MKSSLEVLKDFCSSMQSRSPNNLMMVGTMSVLRPILCFAVICIMVSVNCSAPETELQYACDFQKHPHLKWLPFCDTFLPDAHRVEDFISRLTLEEKFAELVNSATNVSRLGVPRYQWWNEGLHGIGRSPGVDYNGTIHATTSFPSPILTAASFNTALWDQIGQVVSTEARALYNVGRANLTFWTPNINIVRDPRWGRAQETSGEDPLVASTYAIHFVRGMQEDSDYVHSAQTDLDPQNGPRRLKVSACCKHYVAYDLENWQGMDRYHFDAKVTEQDLEDSYNPPFKSCIQEGRASGLMCSYNAVNGVPSCANHKFLTDIVRKQWGLDGYIVSDCGAVLDMHRDTPYAPTSEDAVAAALNAGVDVECGSYSLNYGPLALSEGKVKESTIDRAIFHQYLVRMRLGMFDGDPRTRKYGGLGTTNVCTADNQELAVEAARQSFVLLKNDENTLPFARSSDLTLAVVGPHANSSVEMLGNYKGFPCKYITPLQGLAEFGVKNYNKLIYAPGCNETDCEGDDLILEATLAASKANAIIILAGLNQTQEKEKLDRTSLLLPGYQEQMIKAVAEAAKGKPILLIIMSGGPVDVSFAKMDKRIQSILWVGYPGEAGGQAMAEVIFGDHNPGGKLPLSWYPEDYTIINMTDMHMRPDATTGYPGRTYRFHTGPVVYEFGHGLSYTKFAYQFTSAPVTLQAPSLHHQLSYQQGDASSSKSKSLKDNNARKSANFKVSLMVKNTGMSKGHDIVLLYAKPPAAGTGGAPLKELVAFRKLYLEKGAEIKIIFNLNAFMHLATVRRDGKSILEIGTHTLLVGHQKHDITIWTA